MMHLNLLYSYVVVDCNSRSKVSRYKLFLTKQRLEMRFHRNILISNTAYSVHFCICVEAAPTETMKCGLVFLDKVVNDGVCRTNQVPDETKNKLKIMIKFE